MSSYLPSTTYNFELQAAAAAGSGRVGNEVTFPRDPTTTDLSGPSGGYSIGQLWYSTSSATLFILASVSGGVATWSASTAAITTPLTVPNGGTGRITLTNHGVLVGSGTGAVTQLSVGSSGQVLVGSTGADPVFATLTSSDNSISFTTGAGTLSLQANLNTDFASPGPIGSVAPNTGAFTTLTSSGNTTLGTATAGTIVTIGNSVQTGTITIGQATNATGQSVLISSAASISGPNIVSILAGATPAANQTFNLMTGVGTAGTYSVNVLTGNSTGTTQALNLATGSAATTIAIGGSGANAITIANSQTGGSIAIGAAMTTGTIAIGGTGLQTGTITVGGGTGAQTVNVATGGTGIKTVHIADSAVANVVTIGSTTGAASLTLNAGSAGIAMNGAVTSANAVTVTAGAITATNGNLVLGTAGNKILSSSVATTTTAGANSFGTVTLASGTATVNTSAVTSSSLIVTWRQSVGASTALGSITAGTIVNGVSFVVSAATQGSPGTPLATDASVVGWMLIN